jgi:mannitol 2-dehydrogenase
MIASTSPRRRPEPIELCEGTLASVPSALRAPTYDRSRLRPAVVHIGVGGFHRAHQAVYFDELARRGIEDWGVVGVGLHGTEMGEALWPQDCLYTLIEQGHDAAELRVVGVMGRYLHGASQSEAVLETLSHPETRLVTLTITGDGYNLDPSGAFVADSAEVARDLRHCDQPDTAYGYLVEALRRRRRDGLPPFTVLSCDNIPRNGEAARTMVISFAALRDPQLAGWIDRYVSFPNSMVDRITPQTTPQAREALARSFGVSDRWPVVTEPFSQWVIEDHFCNGRPPLDLVGAQFVADVSTYELTKKRLLNGSHCALSYLGVLAGHTTTCDVMNDRALAAFVSGFVDEITPLLPAATGLNLDRYKATLLDRLSNPSIADELSRLCRRGSTKMPSYLLPSISDAIAAGRPHELMTLALAGWIRYLAGVDDTGSPIHVEDARAAALQPLARRALEDPGAVLAERSVFGSLGDNRRFVEELQRALAALSTGRSYLSVQAAS